jgi:transcriptional regulator with XRE-family HTH domain
MAGQEEDSGTRLAEVKERGAHLRNLRESRGLSRLDTAILIGCSPGTLTNLEAGYIPDNSEVYPALCTALAELPEQAPAKRRNGSSQWAKRAEAIDGCRAAIRALDDDQPHVARQLLVDTLHSIGGKEPRESWVRHG